MPQTKVKHHTLCHFELPCHDPEKVSHFYQKLFGWEIKKMDIGGMAYWFIKTTPEEEAVTGGLMKTEKSLDPVVNYILVDSVDAFLKKAMDLGAKLLTPKTLVPGMGHFAVFSDLEGNSMGLWETL
ncbi:MAG: VOC family protein [Armatimonadetes bacterium]|nr:VOC family protein [Armatimonadota bacterium]